MVRDAAVRTEAPGGAHRRPERVYLSPRRQPLAPPKALAWEPALLFVFIASLFVPGTFTVGPIQLSPYKIVLLLAIVPLGLRWISGGAGRIVAPDVFMLLFCLWQALAVLLAHGPSRIFFIGTTFMEGFGAYLVGRTLVRCAADWRALFRYFLYCLAFLLPFALAELVLGRRVFAELFAKVFTLPAVPRERRLGLLRVALGFPHPIHLGVIASMGLANVYYIYRDRFLRGALATGLTVVMTVTSLSSGPMLSAGLQAVMIGWDRMLRFIRGHWLIGGFIGVFTLAMLQMLLPGGLIGYIVNEVIFNPYGGNNRIDIIRYGSAEVARHPLFGIGLAEWVRPYWQHGTVDNFWLLTAMRYGLPALAFLLLAIGIAGFRIMTLTGLSEEIARYRTGYLIAGAGLVVSLGTVHVWQAPVAFIMTYIGAGLWFYTGPEAAEAAARPRMTRAARDARPPAGAAGRARRAGPRPIRASTDDPTRSR